MQLKCASLLCFQVVGNIFLQIACIGDYTSDIVIIDDGIIISSIDNLKKFISLPSISPYFNLLLSNFWWFKTISFFNLDFYWGFLFIVLFLPLIFLGDNFWYPSFFDHLYFIRGPSTSLILDFIYLLLILFLVNHFIFKLISKFFEFTWFNNELISAHINDTQVHVEDEKLRKG